MNIFLIIKWSHVDVMRPGLSLSLRAWLSWHHDVSLSGIAHLLISRSRKIKKNLRWYRIGIGRYSEFSGSDLIWKKWYRCIPKQDLAPILISPPHTYVHNPGNDDRRNKWRWHKHIQTKANMISCVKKLNQCYHLSRRNNTDLGVRFGPFLLLEILSPLKSCSDIYAGPTSCLIVNLRLNVLFLRYFFFLSLSIVDLLISVWH